MKRLVSLLAVGLLCGSVVAGVTAGAPVDPRSDASAGGGAAAPAPSPPAADTAAVAAAVDPPSALTGGPPAAVSDDGANATGPHVLSLPDDGANRTGFASPTANLSATLSMRADRLEGRLDTLRVRERLGAIDSPGAKRKYIQETLSEIEIASGDLRGQQGKAISRHTSDESYDTRRLLVRLARLDATAEELRLRAAVLRNASEEMPRFSVEGRSRVVELQLRTLEGPVRDHVTAVLRGSGPSGRVYTETTAHGVVISAIADGTYVREAYDGSRTTVNPPNHISISQLSRVMERSYPSLMRNGTMTSPPGAQASNIFRATVDHPDGRLSALVDRGSGRVFKESQRLTLSDSLAGPAVTATASGLRITVNRSYPGGPMRVNVVDAATGLPADTTVGHPVSPSAYPVTLGTTNASDGTFWTLSPGGTFVVQAVDEPAAAAVDVDSLAPPRVGDERRASGDNATDGDAATAAPAPSDPNATDGDAATATPTPTETPTATPTPTETPTPAAVRPAAV